MTSIFISYRRVDAQEVVGRIYDRLTAYFPVQAVFRDLDAIPLGKTFPAALKDSLESADIALVIIGPQWHTVTDDVGQRRLDDEADFVRIEVETVLTMQIPVIPVLVMNAGLPPAAELPESIRPLVQRQGIPVRSDPDFHRDMDRLIGKISAMLPDASEEPPELDTEIDIRGKQPYDWASEVGQRGFDIVKVGMTILYEEHSLLDPSYDESIYRNNRQLRIPPNPFRKSQRGFVKLDESDWEWLDPRDRNRRICEGTIEKVLPDGRVKLSGMPFTIGKIVDVLDD